MQNNTSHDEESDGKASKLRLDATKSAFERPKDAYNGDELSTADIEEAKARKIIAETFVKDDLTSLYSLEFKELYYVVAKK